MKFLPINTGASSLKATLYDCAALDPPQFAVTLERIGYPRRAVRVADRSGGHLLARPSENLPTITDWAWTED